MKKKRYHISLLFFALVFSFSGFSKDLDYAVDIYHFRSPAGTPYLELNLSLSGKSLNYVQNEKGEYKGVFEVVYFIQEGIKKEEEAEGLRVKLETPFLKDTIGASTELTMRDIRKVPVHFGKINVTGVITDLNDPGKTKHHFEKELWVDEFKDKSVTFSSILLIEKPHKNQEESIFNKYGYSIQPRLGSNYFENEDSLFFYSELYHSTSEDESVPYFINSYLVKSNSGIKLKDYQKTIKRKTKPLDLYFASFDISKLPSETYFLYIDVYNKMNELVGQSFQKLYVYNSTAAPLAQLSTDGDFDRYFEYSEPELDHFIRTLMYISTPKESDFANSLKTFTHKKNYFVSFWEKRQKNPSDTPATLWRKYKAKIDYTNENYKSAFNQGWRTDRGRVLMQYGAPNDIERFPAQPNSVPYEIWHYNTLSIQNNVVFVFYEPTVATEDYELIHSTFRGEVNNPGYQKLINSRMNMTPLDDNSFQNGVKESFYMNPNGQN